MAEERILDAEALINGGRWAGAYYVAGYAVECGLKACLLARMIHTGWVFQEGVKAEKCRTHDFDKLIEIADLKGQLDGSLAASPAFSGNWDLVSQWKVSTRYEPKTEAEARALYAAITDNPDGVLRWIRNYW
jgi:hypothetical protein